ncbi:MAG: hypothetical protein IPM54_41160 [Polyangiaceae bacterium]|nr:hypothetical protein [Polyangiaceae bacterium]
MIEALPVGLLVAFVAAFRRARLVALDVAHIAWHREGITVHRARSTTDQLRERANVPVRAAPGVLCPVRALRTWLDTTKIVGGQTIRTIDRWGRTGTNGLTSRAVALIVNKAAKRAGLGPYS